jgi:hypothetical protein
MPFNFLPLGQIAVIDTVLELLNRRKDIIFSYSSHPKNIEDDCCCQLYDLPFNMALIEQCNYSVQSPSSKLLTLEVAQKDNKFVPIIDALSGLDEDIVLLLYMSFLYMNSCSNSPLKHFFHNMKAFSLPHR